MAKLSSPISHSEKEDDDPWYRVPIRHVHYDTAIKHGGVRIVDRFEWQDLPVEYYRVSGSPKHAEHRGGVKTVRMKHIEKKPGEVSPIKQFWSNVFMLVSGTLLRSLSTDGSRRSSVSPADAKSRKSRGMTQV